MFREFLYSSLICLEIKILRSFKSFAPKFFAKSSSILAAIDFLTSKILH